MGERAESVGGFIYVSILTVVVISFFCIIGFVLFGYIAVRCWYAFIGEQSGIFPRPKLKGRLSSCFGAPHLFGIICIYE